MTAAARDSKESVGPYRLLRAIGAGGSARIDLARIDRAYNFQRHVVVKRPLEHLRGDPAVAASLRREARIGGMLRHPNLVAVLDAGIHDDYDYLVLEYIHGTSLRTLMQPEGAGAGGGLVRDLPLPVALGIAIDVARGLHDAHELVDDRGASLGLVHRDVSPGNVLLGLDGAVKLADFGIAKETRVATLSGSMHGTVTYMAPEQCRGHAFDRRADIFSIGVILYELVTHVRLFWADNDVASLHRVLSGQVAPPRTIVPGLSPALEDIVMTAVAQDPANRFATARQFGDALEGLAAAEGHVVGARWLAHTLEGVLGPKYAPWIAATTVVEAVPPVDAPRISEPSLVDVIQLAPPDAEPIYPTFGPSDERAIEEGSVPEAPIMRAPLAPVTAPPPRRRWRFVAAALVLLVGIGAGVVAVTIGTNNRATQPPAPSHAPEIMTATPPPPAPEPTVGADVGVDPDVVEVDQHPKPPVHGKSHRPKPHVTNPIIAGSNAGSAVTIPTETGSGSAAHAPNVEWKPTMLLPTDTGSGNKKP